MYFPSRYRSGGSDVAGLKTNPKLKLTDTQWLTIAKYFPNKEMTRRGGRSEVHYRDCFDGVLFVLITGCRWQESTTAAE